MMCKLLTASALALLALVPISTAGVLFSTNSPDGKIAMASRPENLGAGKIEIEAADDFLFNSAVSIDSATFVGLLPIGVPVGSINQVRVEIYRVFPKDSVNPPSGNVTTRVNSPSDVVFDDRNSVGSTLTYTTSILNPSFTALNSVLNGINKFPNQTTGGEGAVTGQEVQFNVSFPTPFSLPADHYFFIPQVGLSTGNFYWLSAPKPIVSPGTPFTPDLQAWIRNASLDPDWSRVGTDIVGAGTFNGAFTLSGNTPEPSTLLLLGGGLLVVGVLRRRAR